ncbi:ABC transporter permease [Pullulanibacillus sp. KACC 23026]|uniref:ABC transporter permease n=1 Tax=Pullulanibacillus sp. KACC 23026 TaxID=3028315 RepID=UPI0023B1BB71|nr:ABC transporter permease [Pullulanibacillus sp. KACC 23026]WEG11028.1 ABC transporter permease [Pullulanibacillus sp. KACC 23026]
MGAYLAKRLLYMIPILFGVSFLVFSMMHLMPGDPARMMLGQQAAPAAIEALRTKLGLNQPFLVQYIHWLSNILRGDLGTSITMQIPVSAYLFPKLINTLILAAGGLIVCVVIGIGMGLISALRKYTWIDRVLMFLAQFGANTPGFWLAITLMWLFATKLGWLPSTGMYDVRTGPSFIGLIKHLIMPAFATATVSLAVIARLTRSSLIDVMNAEFIKTFRANGISESKIIWKHAFRNILAPLLNMIGLQIGYLLGGALFVEVVFNWPGIGSQIYASITSEDMPMVQAGVLFIAACFVLINLINDIIIAFLNPRLKS